MADSITAVKSAGLVLQTSDNLGAMEIGTFVGLILYGVTLAQGYVYFAKYKSDPVYMRAMVMFDHIIRIYWKDIDLFFVWIGRFPHVSVMHSGTNSN